MSFLGVSLELSVSIIVASLIGLLLMSRTKTSICEIPAKLDSFCKKNQANTVLFLPLKLDEITLFT